MINLMNKQDIILMYIRDKKSKRCISRETGFARKTVDKYINDYETSYSTNQNAFLLDKSSLSKVIGVVINEDSAILTVVLVPKKIYDKDKYKNMSR